MMNEAVAYRIRPAIVAPVLLTICAVWLALCVNVWALAAIPFIVLGSISAAPNLNLADGFLAVIAATAGLVISNYYRDVGSAIFVGTSVSWFLTAMEKRIRAEPINDGNVRGRRRSPQR